MNNIIHKSDKIISLLLERKFNNIIISNLDEINKIQLLDNLLNQISNSRKIINKIKVTKDGKIKNYIRNTLPPRILNINILTYKALLMYFRDTFINNTISLKYEKYKEKNKLNNKELQHFFPTKETFIKVYLNNFPHLIGIKKDFLGNSNKVIEYIIYEHELIDDFIKDGTNTDIEKLETFSWIISTLYNPTWIINEKAIKAPNFKSDIVFIKRIFYPHNFKQRKYYYHIVGLSFIKDKENFFVIKSQFPIKNKTIFERKFDLNRSDGLIFKRI